MLPIAICDDNPVFQEILSQKIESLISQPYKLSIFSSGEQLLDSVLSGEQYSIILMDIELDKDAANGIEFAKKLTPYCPNIQILFISQYLDYASDVYQVKHTYFISKDHLDKYLPDALQAALDGLNDAQLSYLNYTKQKKQYHIPLNDILYLERVIRTTEIHTTSDVYYIGDSLKNMIELLSSQFVFCHRSIVVNLNAIKTMNWECITLKNGSVIPVGRTHYAQLKRSYAQFILH